MKLLTIIFVILFTGCTCYQSEIVQTRKKLSDIDFQVKELLKADSADFDEDQIIFLSIDKSILEDRLKELEAKSHCF